MTIVALDAIENMLTVEERKSYNYSICLDEECRGIGKLEPLQQQHTDNAVYEKELRGH